MVRLLRLQTSLIATARKVGTRLLQLADQGESLVTELRAIGDESAAKAKAKELRAVLAEIRALLRQRKEVRAAVRRLPEANAAEVVRLLRNRIEKAHAVTKRAHDRFRTFVGTNPKPTENQVADYLAEHPPFKRIVEILKVEWTVAEAIRLGETETARWLKQKLAHHYGLGQRRLAGLFAKYEHDK